jgi:sec-independent protein translocase protein TatA
MSIGMSELLLILVIIFVLFGAGKLPQVMNDLGKGISGLKKGLRDAESKENRANSISQPDQTNQASSQNGSETKNS